MFKKQLKAKILDWLLTHLQYNFENLKKLIAVVIKQANIVAPNLLLQKFKVK